MRITEKNNGRERLVKPVKAGIMVPLMQEIIAQGKQVRLRVTGSSMYPTLREDIDGVELTGCSFHALRKGDIALIRRSNGQFILHRVVYKTDDSFYLAGDAQQWIEGPLQPQQLIAAASAIYRKEFRIACTSSVWRIYSHIWSLLLPCRKQIIAVISKSGRLIKKSGIG